MPSAPNTPLKFTATILTAKEKEYASNTPQYLPASQSSDLLNRHRGNRRLHLLLSLPTLSRQPSAFSGGISHEEQNNPGSTIVAERDGRYNQTTIQVMRNQLGKGQGDSLPLPCPP